METASLAFEALERDLKRGPARQLRAARDETATTMDQAGDLGVDGFLDDEAAEEMVESLERLLNADDSTRMN